MIYFFPMVNFPKTNTSFPVNCSRFSKMLIIQFYVTPIFQRAESFEKQYQIFILVKQTHHFSCLISGPLQRVKGIFR